MSIVRIGICKRALLMGPLFVLIFGIQLELLPDVGWGKVSADKRLK